MSSTKRFWSKWFDNKRWNWLTGKRYYGSAHHSTTRQYIQKTENRKFRRKGKKFVDDIASGEEVAEPKSKKNVLWQLW